MSLHHSARDACAAFWGRPDRARPALPTRPRDIEEDLGSDAVGRGLVRGEAGEVGHKGTACGIGALGLQRLVETRDHTRRHEHLAQADKDTHLDAIARDRDGVVTGVLTEFAASPSGAARRDVGRAAAPTSQQSREQVSRTLRRAGSFWGGGSAAGGHLSIMPQCGPSLRTFVATVTTSGLRLHTVQVKASFRCGCADVGFRTGSGNSVLSGRVHNGWAVTGLFGVIQPGTWIRTNNAQEFPVEV